MENTKSNGVYTLIEVQIKDAEKFEQYAQETTPLVARYNGKIVGQYKIEEIVEGSSAANLLLIQEWASETDFRNWYDSPEYQPLKEMRRDAAEVKIILATAKS